MSCCWPWPWKGLISSGVIFFSNSFNLVYKGTFLLALEEPGSGHMQALWIDANVFFYGILWHDMSISITFHISPLGSD